MKQKINISQRWKKFIVILLLINFVTTPFLNALPENKCDSACKMKTTIHACCSKATIKKKSNCCSMMEMNSNDNSTNNTKCPVKLSKKKCTPRVVEQKTTEYLIPKTIDCEVELVVFSALSLEENNVSIAISNYSYKFYLDSSPPIYLMISSFLN